MISRDWRCAHCEQVFHSFEPYPGCPKCGSVKVTWVPGGGHVARHGAIDRTVRQLADGYGMTDVNTPSPSRLNRAMPKHEPAVADGPVMSFAPGFAAPFNTQGRATCEPSRQRVDFRTTVAAEAPLAAQQTNYPHIGRSGWTGIRRPYR